MDYQIERIISEYVQTHPKFTDALDKVKQQVEAAFEAQTLDINQYVKDLVKANKRSMIDRILLGNADRSGPTSAIEKLIIQVLRPLLEEEFLKTIKSILTPEYISTHITPILDDAVRKQCEQVTRSYDFERTLSTLVGKSVATEMKKHQLNP